MARTTVSDLDALLEAVPVAPPSLTGATGRKCRRHEWTWGNRFDEDGITRSVTVITVCARCGKPKDEALSRRGKQSRNYGNRAELAVSRKYGGTKVGHAGGPVDVRGKDFATQVKTHRRMPPAEWTKSFAAMSQDNRCPRMLLRFVMGPGVPPADYFVFEADAFLDWFGRDDEH